MVNHTYDQWHSPPKGGLVHWLINDNPIRLVTVPSTFYPGVYGDTVEQVQKSGTPLEMPKNAPKCGVMNTEYC